MNNIVMGLLAGAGVYLFTKSREIVAPTVVTPPVVVPVVPIPSGVTNPLPVAPPIVVPPIVVVNPPVSTVPVATGAGVLWEENWEDLLSSYMSSDRWGDTSCPGEGVVSGNPRISTDRPYNGTKSLKFVYDGHQQEHINSGLRVSAYHLPEWPVHGHACNNHRYYTPQDEVWVRWMEFMEPGFIVDEIGTKGLQMIVSSPSQPYSYYFWLTYMWGAEAPNFGRELSGGIPYITAAGTPDVKNYGHNMNKFLMPDGQWVCYEVHLKMNDPGVANGLFEMFVTPKNTGVTQQCARYTNIPWRSMSGARPQVAPNEKFGGVGCYVQDGMGKIYRDLIAVGTQRIGVPA